IEPNLPREKEFLNKNFINYLMKQKIKDIIDLTTTAAVDPDKTPHIMDENVIETLLIQLLFFPEYQYTLILYPKSEEYNTLDTTYKSKLLPKELWQPNH
ncbi:20160_t:CDS:2, partial [Funneliformis geosporum]